jgi:hypothetical protein
MGITTELMEISADKLSIDPRVQRVVDPRRVAKLAKDWDDLMVGVITVSHRENVLGNVAGLDPGAADQFVILDGQTRWQALKIVCGQGTTTCSMMAQVHTGLTLKDEARIFLQHNDRKGVTPLDTFRIALVAGEEWAESIRDIAARYRWAVAGTGNGSQRTFQAVAAAKKLYLADESGRTLDRVFNVIDAAWPRERDGVCGETLHGIGGLYATHAGLDTAGFVVKLAKIGFNKYYSSVRDTYRAHPSMGLAQAAYVRTVEIYNSNRKFDSGRRIEL